MARKVKRKSNKDGKVQYKKYKSEIKPVICYSPGVCPDIMRVQLAYQENRSLSGGGLAIVQDYVYRGNSAFDPNFTGVGAQPLGFDQWSAFYKRYRVIASRIDVHFGADAAVNFVSGVVPLTSSAGLTIAEQLTEAAFAKTKALGNDTGLNANTISSYMPTATIRGMPVDGVRYAQDLSSLTSTNPVQEWFWHVFVYAQDGSLTWKSDISVKITYYIEFYDRTTLSRS